MTTGPPPSKEHLLFQSVDHAQSSEYLRLMLALLGKYKIAPSSVNLALLYHHVAGHSQQLSDQIDTLLQQPDQWTSETANRLFTRYLHGCDEQVLTEIRDELISVTDITIGSLVNLATTTSESADRMRQHLDTLAEHECNDKAINTIGLVLEETRKLLTETSQLGSQLKNAFDEMQKIKEELALAKNEATQDALTGVMNRRAFDLHLAKLMQSGDEAAGNEFSIILLDIDHFKMINDNHGHLTGDKVLHALGGLLQRHTKGSDICARYGGEEFAILLPDTRITNAFNLAENLRSNIQKLVLRRPSSGNIIGDISASFGVAAFRRGETAEQLLDRVDKALYRAKRNGRNRVTLAD